MPMKLKHIVFDAYCQHQNLFLTVIKYIMERRLWTSQEDQIITNLVNQHGKKKWTLISDEMQKIMPRNSRTSKQIRQRWHNHLDPDVNKKPWTLEEEKILFEAHHKLGSKWKQIASQLHKRTDNYVKNHFYSTLRRSLRRINKYLGSKNSTNQMRMIRPSILSYLLDLSESDQECRILVSKIFEFATYKPSKGSLSSLINEEDKEQFQFAINKLIQINQTYAEQKTHKNTKTQPRVKEFSQIKEEYSQKNELSTLKNPQEIQDLSEERIYGEVGSWHNESPINHQYHLLPQIQVPEYECGLLSEGLNNFEEVEERIQSRAMEEVNMFNC